MKIQNCQQELVSWRGLELSTVCWKGQYCFLLLTCLLHPVIYSSYTASQNPNILLEHLDAGTKTGEHQVRWGKREAPQSSPPNLQLTQCPFLSAWGTLQIVTKQCYGATHSTFPEILFYFCFICLGESNGQKSSSGGRTVLHDDIPRLALFHVCGQKPKITIPIDQARGMQSFKTERENKQKKPNMFCKAAYCYTGQMPFLFNCFAVLVEDTSHMSSYSDVS